MAKPPVSLVERRKDVPQGALMKKKDKKKRDKGKEKAKKRVKKAKSHSNEAFVALRKARTTTEAARTKLDETEYEIERCASHASEHPLKTI